MGVAWVRGCYSTQHLAASALAGASSAACLASAAVVSAALAASFATSLAAAAFLSSSSALMGWVRDEMGGEAVREKKNRDQRQKNDFQSLE